MERILLIIPNFGAGGAQRSFSNLSNELNKQFEVINVVFNLDRQLFYPLDGKLINLDVSGGGFVFQKIHNFFLRVTRLRKIKKQYNVKASISFLEGADYVNILSKKSDKIILSIRGSKLHDGNINGFLGTLRKKIMIPWLYRQADEIVVVNKGIAEELNESFNLKSVHKVVISNFYDKEHILELGNASLPIRYNWLMQGQYIVISSRLAREKNILAMISVFAALKQLGFAGKLVIVGNGPEASKIVAHCHQLNLKSSTDEETDDYLSDVICVGADSNPYRYVKRSMCFLMASESEGFPNALVEAMILGVPVVSSDCPWGPREVLDPDMKISSVLLTQPIKAQLGVLMPKLTFDAESINIWAIFLNKFLQDREGLLRYSKDASEGVNVYTKENSINKWLAVIQQHSQD